MYQGTKVMLSGQTGRAISWPVATKETTGSRLSERAGDKPWPVSQPPPEKTLTFRARAFARQDRPGRHG